MKRYLYNFLQEHPRYRYLIRRYLLLWLAAILFDVHRYGCWVTGDQAYWHPPSYILLPVSMLPFLPGVLSLWVIYAENRNRQYLYKFVLLWIPGITSLVVFVTGGRIFSPEWWDRSLLMGNIRNDSSTYAAIGLVVLASFCVWTALRNGENPFDM